MLELRFNIEPNEDGVFDGVELARGMIAQAAKLLAPYVDHCPACTGNLFSVVANEELELLQQEGLEGLVMSVAREGVNEDVARARHIEAMAGKVGALLEKAENQHEHG